MAVIINFMDRFESILMSGEKSRTNRAYSKTRNKINIGDTVQIKVGNRFKGLKKLFDAIITNKKIWTYDQVPIDSELAAALPSPKDIEAWREFALKDGFEKYQEFIEYFDPEQHPKKQSKYIFFEFKKLEEYYSSNYTSLEVFMKC